MRLYQRLKRQILSQVYLVRIGLGLAIVAGGMALWFTILGPITLQGLTFWKSIQASLSEASGRTNFLILGREGVGATRAGASLTDTMVLASVAQSSGDTVLLTIPRDLWVASLKAKINTAYYYGEQRQSNGGGLILSKAAVSEIVDQPVHYAAVIDFGGFEKIIDLIGGVDINVDRAFVDHKYPIAGREDDLCDGDSQYLCRYETIQFQSGLQHMTGATALKFVRSRQAEGDEGTDFARSKRQEKLLLALRDKLLSKQVLTNYKLWRALYGQLSQSIITDITPDLYPALTRLGLRTIHQSIRTATLAEPDQVTHPPVSVTYGFQWVLLPTADLPLYIKNLLAIPGQN